MGGGGGGEPRTCPARRAARHRTVPDAADAGHATARPRRLRQAPESPSGGKQNQARPGTGPGGPGARGGKARRGAVSSRAPSPPGGPAAPRVRRAHGAGCPSHGRRPPAPPTAVRAGPSAEPHACKDLGQDPKGTRGGFPEPVPQRAWIPSPRVAPSHGLASPLQSELRPRIRPVPATCGRWLSAHPRFEDPWFSWATSGPSPEPRPPASGPCHRDTQEFTARLQVQQGTVNKSRMPASVLKHLCGLTQLSQLSPEPLENVPYCQTPPRGRKPVTKQSVGSCSHPDEGRVQDASQTTELRFVQLKPKQRGSPSPRGSGGRVAMAPARPPWRPCPQLCGPSGLPSGQESTSGAEHLCTQ
ncbi:bifunctional peptidase and arginyl-hydroxylase JMJD5 isoform X4 [Prionailurus viverrinus]|uniref:bifunctional peptidase and arginyl-hydroxylase JMJD5 isoform X4 n=1 Tax=Prionailurus viverrinus TaxID=61388 RepID=UPI001FF5BD68|nr:bifunctional peptidase and arginyl-hydroxylase JMJD5 isoform X4 [Prionailurus viverrinus]